MYLKLFSNIKDVSTKNIASIPEIRVWLPQSERPDLTISLDECGTGIGQVMAMLYVIIQSDEPKVIIIDEPNSFLHPSASRKLMEIIKQYDHHQYIISTHSPELITSAEADNILLLTLNEEGQTQIKKN
ncbi:MAG: ATP-binding protein [Saprospiraceae bacterium]|nr:ATP-binding protein [Saprospiraceae bacterium]